MFDNGPAPRVSKLVEKNSFEGCTVPLCSQDSTSSSTGTLGRQVASASSFGTVRKSLTEWN